MMKEVVSLIDSIESQVHFKVVCADMEASTGFPEYTIQVRLDQLKALLASIHRCQELLHTKAPS